MDANISKVLIGKEAAFGVVASGPALALAELRFLSSAVANDKLTVMSEEIRSDRARSKLIKVGTTGGGAIETEFIIGASDDLTLAALLAEEWTTGSAVVTANATNSSDTITVTAGTLNAAAQGAKFVHVSGFANALNNGIKRVISMTATEIVVDSLGADQTGAAVTIVWRYARNGVYLDSFLLEQQYLGLDTPEYIAFPGCVLNQWTLSMEAQARILQTYDFLATRALLDDATFGDGAPAAASTRDICNTTGNIGGLYWDGTLLTTNVMGFNLTVNNNLRERPALAREYTLRHGKGRCEPDGQINAYFESRALFESFLNHTAAGLLMPITDPDGNLFSVHMPHLEFPSGFPTIDGVNSDVMLPLDFNATIHDSLGYVIQVDQLSVTEEGS